MREHDLAKALASHVSDGWGSHVPMLVAAFCETTGPVLEFGAGHHSTPLLHSLCSMSKRPLLTVESDPEWWSKFHSLTTELHAVRLMPAWGGWESVMSLEQWGLVFVDHQPTKHRAAVLNAVSKTSAAVVVLHDAQRIDYRKAMATYPRREVMDIAGMPSTAAMSHRRPA